MEKSAISKLVISAVALITLASCGCEGQLKPSVNTIEEYAKARGLVNGIVENKSDVYNVYFDFSCINYATDMKYRTDPEKKKNYDLFDLLVTHITSGTGNYQFFKVDDKGTSMIDNEGTTALYDVIKNAPNNEKTQIVSALDKIISVGKPAVYVTDFEGYDGDKFDRSAFAAKDFSAWLKMGNKITFLATDYKEKMRTDVVDKWMYITIFDFAEGSLTKEIKEHLRNASYKEFVMTNSFSVMPAYDNVLKGGDYHDKNGHPQVCGTNEDGSEFGFKSFANLNAEFYPFTVKWEDMRKTAADLTQYGEPKYSNFMSKLKVLQKDFAQCYQIKSFKLKVDDIQNDFDSYFEPTVDANGKVSFKHGNAAFTSVSDLFEMDMRKYNTKSDETELAFNLSSKYSNGTPIGMTCDNDLLCVQLLVDDVDTKYDDSIFRRSDKVDGLSKSVFDALKNARPMGKLVYTYFMVVL